MNKKSLENLKSFKPGQSGNPKGRPSKKNCLTSLLKEEIEKINPEDKDKRTWKEMIVIATMKLAIAGNSTALKEVWERIDGKVILPIGGSDGGPLEISDARERLINKLADIALKNKKTRSNSKSKSG